MDKIKLNNFNTKLVIEMNGPSKISASLDIKGNLEIISRRRNFNFIRGNKLYCAIAKLAVGKLLNTDYKHLIISLLTNSC